MTVKQVDGVVILEGNCGVEEAETLLQAILAAPAARIDWSGCQQIHTAVVQIILAAKIPVRNPCGNAWFRRWGPELFQ